MAKRRFNKKAKIEVKPDNLGVAKSNQRVSRKTKRKEAKLLKKAKRQMIGRERTLFDSTTVVRNEDLKRDDAKKAKRTKKPKQQKDNEVTRAEITKKRLLEENQLEERNIRRLEKQLKLNRRKNKVQAFCSDGLSYILEACELDARKGLLQEEEDFVDDDNFDDDFAVVMGTKKPIEPAECETEAPENNDAGKKQVKFDLNESSNKDSEMDSEEETESIDEGKKRVRFDLKGSSKKASEKGSDGETESSDADDDASETYEVPASVGRFDLLQCSTERSEDVAGASSNSKRQEKGRKRKQEALKEDIYGRLRDGEGNIVTSEKETQGKYVPPALREKSGQKDAQKAELLVKLSRRLKGLLNRLSEPNLNSVFNDVETLYVTNKFSRNDMNESLIKQIFDAVVQTSVTSERLVQEYAVFVTLLHANIGSEVGSQFLESIAKKLDALIKSNENYGEGKECDNLVLFLVHLYSFKIIHATLIYDVLNIFSNSFKEKDVDLILLILRSAGFNLRKDDPIALKETISKLQIKAKNTEHGNDETRVRFMLDILMAIRNNNMRKIPNYDPSHTEHLRKVLRNLLKKGKYVVELKVTLADLLEADKKGRWWVVGSAWAGEISSKEPLSDSSKVVPSRNSDNFNAEILEIAQKQRLNTDVRKNIFCTLMTAEDFVDAFGKLLALRLPSEQERNVMQVVIDCCMQEKTFNLYYAHLLKKFLEFNKKYHMIIQYAVWDRIKLLQEATPQQMSNLARLLSFLFLSKTFSVSVLRIIQFAELDKNLVSFLRQIMLEILLHDPEKECRKVFANVSTLPKLALLREGLRLFMDIFLLKNKCKLSADIAEKLDSRIAMVKLVLSSKEPTIRM